MEAGQTSLVDGCRTETFEMQPDTDGDAAEEELSTQCTACDVSRTLTAFLPARSAAPDSITDLTGAIPAPRHGRA